MTRSNQLNPKDCGPSTEENAQTPSNVYCKGTKNEAELNFPGYYGYWRVCPLTLPALPPLDLAHPFHHPVMKSVPLTGTASPEKKKTTDGVT